MLLSYWEPAAELVNDWEKAGRFDARLDDLSSRQGHQRASAPNSAVRAELPIPSVAVAAAAGAARVPRAAKTSVKQGASTGSPTIKAGIARFMAALGTQNLSPETIRKYRTVLEKRLVAWCEKERLTTIAELTVTRMDDFRATWTDSPIYVVLPFVEN